MCPNGSVGVPEPLVIRNGVWAALCASFQSLSNQGIGLVTEQFDPGGRDAELGWALPSVLGWLPEENGGPPSISMAATDPKFQSSVAPSALLYQLTASAVSSTASITDITEPCGFDAMKGSPLSKSAARIVCSRTALRGASRHKLHRETPISKAPLPADRWQFGRHMLLID
jgi:hypothetical protein